MSSPGFQKDGLFITMQYLRTVNEIHKYHWGLFSAGQNAPRGVLLHATDTGRQALDLRLEVRQVKDPRASKSMVVCLWIGFSPGEKILRACADSIPLMDRSRLPRKKPQWTCRVWVKNMLFNLNRQRYLELQSDIDTIEQLCQLTADLNINYMGRAKIFNDLGWMSQQNPTIPMDTSPDYTEARNYGSKPMILDSTTTATSSQYSQPTGRYYGTKPMNIDWTGGRY